MKKKKQKMQPMYLLKEYFLTNVYATIFLNASYFTYYIKIELWFFNRIQRQMITKLLST